MGVAKPFRQEQIMKIIRSQQIFTQEELRQELKKQGIEASQETLSRDLRELRLSRTVKGYIETLPQEGGYRIPEIAEDNDRALELQRLFLEYVKPAPSS